MADRCSVFDDIDGLKPVDPAGLAEYERAMRDEAIPAIIEEIRKRQRLAAKARLLPLT